MTPAASAARSTKFRNDLKTWKTTRIAAWPENLRDHGGYSKVDVPFLEFLWANHLRQKVPRHLLIGDPKEALSKALKLAASRKSSFLPGWCGKT